MPNFLASHTDRRLAGVPLPALCPSRLHTDYPGLKTTTKLALKNWQLKRYKTGKISCGQPWKRTPEQKCAPFIGNFMSKTSFSSCDLNLKNFTLLFSLKLYLLRSCLEQRLYPRPQTQEPVLEIKCCTRVQCIKWKKAGCSDKPCPSRAVPLTSSPESPQNKGGKPLIQRVKHSLVIGHVSHAQFHP